MHRANQFRCRLGRILSKCRSLDLAINSVNASESNLQFAKNIHTSSNAGAAGGGHGAAREQPHHGFYVMLVWFIFVHLFLIIYVLFCWLKTMALAISMRFYLFIGGNVYFQLPWSTRRSGYWKPAAPVDYVDRFARFWLFTKFVFCLTSFDLRLYLFQDGFEFISQRGANFSMKWGDWMN